MRFLFGLFFLLFISSAMYAQIAKTRLRGDLYFSKKQYALAIEEYENVPSGYRKDSTKMRLAICYYKLQRWDDARLTLKQIKQRKLSDSVVVMAADIYKKLNKGKLAIQEYKRAQKVYPKRKEFERAISILTSGKTDEKITVEPLNSINTPYSEIAACRFDNGIIFSSNQEGTIIKKKTGPQHLPSYDLYFAKDSLNPNGSAEFSGLLNTGDHESCASFTSDYKTIFYTRSIDETSGGGRNTLKLYSAHRDNNSWKDLQVFRFNDTTHSYAHATVEASEELFFFASDKAGGYGGTDLYVCFNIENKWTDPVNLGPGINSRYNEMYPFFSRDGSLYFSSDRPEGLGGYDVYKANENEDGDYELVGNVGAPINSAFDEFSFFLSEYGYGYFSSNRPGKGLEDLYLFKSK